MTLNDHSEIVPGAATAAPTKPLAVSVAHFRTLVPMSKSACYAAIRAGTLATFHVGRRRFIRMDSVEALMDGRDDHQREPSDISPSNASSGR